MKCSQTSIGVPIQGISSWKKVFINNVKMKRNWRAGNASVMTLASHSHRVLCTRIDEMGGICASAGTDKTIKIWSLQDNTLLNTIQNCNLVIIIMNNQLPWQPTILVAMVTISVYSMGLVDFFVYRKTFGALYFTVLTLSSLDLGILASEYGIIGLGIVRGVFKGTLVLYGPSDKREII
jgi:WD40 repeat protein